MAAFPEPIEKKRSSHFDSNNELTWEGKLHLLQTTFPDVSVRN
jgi:hypothetical protein